VDVNGPIASAGEHNLGMTSCSSSVGDQLVSRTGDSAHPESGRLSVKVKTGNGDFTTVIAPVVGGLVAAHGQNLDKRMTSW